MASDQKTLKAELVERTAVCSGTWTASTSSTSVIVRERKDLGTRFQPLHTLYENPSWPFEEAEKTTRDSSLLAYPSKIEA